MPKMIAEHVDIIHGREDSLSSFSSHGFLVRGKQTALIDPGSLIHQKDLSDLNPDLIIATHEHWDHVAAADFFFGVPKLAHKQALKPLNKPLSNVVRPTGHGDQFQSKFTAASDIIDLGNLKLEVLWTPGHTFGSMCLYESVEKVLFVGDTVFAHGGVGRIFLTGNRNDYIESLETLVAFAEKHGVAMICPGHGELVKGEEACLESLRQSLRNIQI